jgi:nucleotide-binding universal stress UspA family protein
MRPDEQLRFPYGNILVPTDGSPGSSRAVDHGLSLAAALDATVHALSVVEGASLGLDVRSTLSTRELESVAADAVDDLLANAGTRGVADTVGHVEHGDPTELIRDTIESSDIDAVVMGTTGRRGTDRILLGSVAENTVRSAPVPVITVGRGE